MGTRELTTGLESGACGRVIKALDPRSRGLVFDSCSAGHVYASLGQALNPHCNWTFSVNGYLVHRSKVGLIFTAAFRAILTGGGEINEYCINVKPSACPSGYKALDPTSRGLGFDSTLKFGML